MERQKVNNFVQKMLKDADLKDAGMLLFKRCYLLRYGLYSPVTLADIADLINTWEYLHFSVN
jgi:hypothetical protein